MDYETMSGQVVINDIKFHDVYADQMVDGVINIDLYRLQLSKNSEYVEKEQFEEGMFALT